jgi:hypothetical protein
MSHFTKDPGTLLWVRNSAISAVDVAPLIVDENGQTTEWIVRGFAAAQTIVERGFTTEAAAVARATALAQDLF